MRPSSRANRNRTGAAATLLADIDEWCARTETKEGRIGSILFRHHGFVALLRKRLKVTPQSEQQVRDLLQENPAGVSHIPDQSPHLRPKLGARAAQQRWVDAVGPDPCEKCGGSSACSYPTCPLRQAA